MPRASRNDPLDTHTFLVEIDSLQAADFSEVSGLEVSNDQIEYRQGSGGSVRKLPGLKKFANIVLKRGVTQSGELFDWFSSGDRRSMKISLLDRQGNTIVIWVVHDAWIARYEGPTLNAQKNEIAIETIEIAHEGFERV
jgi:phage tail-like protein